MKTIDVVRLLESLGHEVKFHKRTDGGILITQIDGRKFEGAKGNNLAREITGQPVSERRKAQLTRINPPKQQLSKEFENALRNAQRWWKKSKKQGKIKKKTWRKIVEREGEAEAIRRLKRQTELAKGYTYPENVVHFVERTRSRVIPISSYAEEWEKICDYMLNHKDKIREVEQLQPLMNLQYDCYSSHIITEEQCIQESRNILNMK